MRKFIVSISLALLCGIAVLCGEAKAAYDVSGRWLLDGGGYAEKGVLRVRLEDNGYMDVLTETVNGVQLITGTKIKIYLTASRLNINAWEYDNEQTFHTPIALPEMNPTLNDPFNLPAVTAEGLTYRVTLTSETSGKVKIYGAPDIDVIGTVNIDSESTIWQSGTEKPDGEDKTSGCSAQEHGVFTLLLLALFPALLKNPLTRYREKC